MIYHPKAEWKPETKTVSKVEWTFAYKAFIIQKLEPEAGEMDQHFKTLADLPEATCLSSSTYTAAHKHL